MNYTSIPVEELLGPLSAVEKKYAPAEFCFLGDRSLFQRGPRVSVIGTRKASREGMRRAAVLAGMLARSGVVVVSGLAEGIDTAAHETAMSEGGHTIAVLGTSLDKPYPSKNLALFRAIAKEHLAISQFAPGTPSHAGNFPMRNRTMALLSDATVIIEAGEGSGTQYQGWEALRLGRPLFLLESLTLNRALSFPEKMLLAGARVLTRENVVRLLEMLPERPQGGRCLLRPTTSEP